MKIISLKCNNCSADLDIPENTKFFKCSFCKTSLGVKHSGNAIYTEVLGEIKGDTSQILENTESILVEKKIARLDRDWEQTKKSYTTYSKEGVPSLPDQNGPLSLYISILFAVCFFVFVFLNSGPFNQQGLETGGIFILIFTIFFLGLIFSTISNSDQADKYSKAKSTYKKKRKELLRELDDL